jgi:hypothetical protein
MNLPPLKVVVIGAVLVLAVFGAVRALSGTSEDTSDAIVRSITTPIQQAARAEAESNVSSAIPAAQIYFADHGSYDGISAAALRTINPGLSPTVQVVPTAGGYCLTATVRGVSVRNVGPSADITDGSC